jgi:dTDP-4-dehydrorhamnose reductase
LFGNIGMLGSRVERLFKEAGHDLLTPSLEEVDFTRPETLERFYRENDFEGVVNCAAYTAVDACEDPAIYPLALKINGEAVGVLARLSASMGRWLIHISTDYVFNGSGTEPHRVDEPTDPLNAYGRTKWEGERLFQAAGNPGYIVRTSWLYGPNGKHFVDTIAGLLKTKPRVEVVDDQVGGPTFSGSLAGFLLDLAETQPQRGVYHFADSGYVSWMGSRWPLGELGLTTPVVPVRRQVQATGEGPANTLVRPSRRPRRWPAAPCVHGARRCGSI